MTTTAQPPTLADVRALSAQRARAEVDEVVGSLAWVERHQVDPRTSGDVAIRDYGDGELLLAGEGAPALSETAVVELITSLGKPDGVGRRWLGKALEVKYRLPRLWRRVLDGEVAVWRALRMAEFTISLPLDGAAFVDEAVAPFAHDLSWAQLERTVEAARAVYDPDEVERRRSTDPRRFDVRLDQTGIDGYVPVDGLLDLADARDVEAAVAARAAQLAEVCDESLEVRRAMALGEICRGELALGVAPGTPTGRGVTLYVHLDGTDVADVDGTPVLVDQVAEWCGGAEVTIKPVIDLNQPVAEHRLHALRLDGRAGSSRLAGVRVPVLHPARQARRPRPPRAVARRPDVDSQPRATVSNPPPHEDLQRVVLRTCSHQRARGPCVVRLDQPERRPVPHRPVRVGPAPRPLRRSRSRDRMRLVGKGPVRLERQLYQPARHRELGRFPVEIALGHPATLAGHPGHVDPPATARHRVEGLPEGSRPEPGQLVQHGIPEQLDRVAGEEHVDVVPLVETGPCHQEAERGAGRGLGPAGDVYE